MSEQPNKHEDRIFSLLTQGDEITWQSLLYDLVKKEGMDPWDVKIGSLTRRYIDTIKTLKEHDFRVSGKVLLAAAILLKIKSSRLVQEDLGELDRLLADPEELPDEIPFDDDADEFYKSEREQLRDVELIPRTPQPRTRKVSIYDLVNALEKALEVKKRRLFNALPAAPVHAPTKTRDVTEIIKDIYTKIKTMFTTQDRKKVMFTELLQSTDRYDKIHTFIPLLHLSQQRKIDLDQEKAFGDIGIFMPNAETEREVAQETA